MVAKVIRGGTCHVICQYRKSNNKYMNCDKRKNHYILDNMTWIIYMDGQCHKIFLYMVLSGLKKHLNLIETSKNPTVKTQM